MKFISWNVNGIRACVQKGFLDFFNEVDADIFCIQESKMQEGQLNLELEGYHQYWNYAEKKGYSGTAIFTQHEPLSVNYGIDVERHDHEGRVITLEYPEFYLVDVYVPNARRDLERLDYRMDWEDAFRQYLLALDAKKPVIYCGDLNVAHEEIDLKNPKTNHFSAGFSDEERVRTYVNHNKLLRLYDGCIGVKTGFTKKSGRCLVGAAEKDGLCFISVTLDAPSDWNDHKKMLDYGYESIEKYLSSCGIAHSLSSYHVFLLTK